MRFIFTIFLIVAAILMLPLSVAAILLIIQAEADHSRFFAFGFLALFSLVAALLQTLHSDGTGHPKVWATIFGIVAAGLLGWAYHTSPTGKAEENPIFESVYEGDGRFKRWHPTNLVAEPDQLKLAASIAGLFGFEFDDGGGKETRKAVSKVYQDLRYHSADLRNYGTQLAACYADWLGQVPNNEHLYYYHPPGTSPPVKGRPVLIVLHSSSGNLKGPLWQLKTFADEMNMAIVAPTFGAGRWGHRPDEALARVRDAIAYCDVHEDLNGSAIVLAGYGTGAQGVALAGERLAPKLRALVFISSDIESEAFLDLTRATELNSMPMLVIHGAVDRIADIARVEDGVGAMQKWKMPVTYKPYTDEGALLLFKRGGEVCIDIEEWMKSWPRE